MSDIWAIILANQLLLRGRGEVTPSMPWRQFLVFQMQDIQVLTLPKLDLGSPMNIRSQSCRSRIIDRHMLDFITLYG